jgi:flavin-dependent dehydrogenase
MRADPAWDVVVVGGGPAGSAAAIAAARHGLRVALMEAARFPRYRPGETLHPGVGVILEQLGVAVDELAPSHARPAGIKVAWGGAAELVPFGADGAGPWRGYQIPGERLDAALLARARASGVTVRHEAARAVLRNGAAVAGVQGLSVTYPAAVTIDASGRRHWLARELNLQIRRHSSPLVARYGYGLGEQPALDDAPSLTADEVGWTWAARIDHGLYHWTRLDVAASAPARTTPPATSQGLRPIGPTRAADVTWRVVEPVAGDGYLLAGEAAAVLDPASSHGVLRALMTGQMAAAAAVAVVADPTAARQAAWSYREWLLEWFRRDAAALAERYHRVSWL